VWRFPYHSDDRLPACRTDLHDESPWTPSPMIVTSRISQTLGQSLSLINCTRLSRLFQLPQTSLSRPTVTLYVLPLLTEFAYTHYHGHLPMNRAGATLFVCQLCYAGLSRPNTVPPTSSKIWLDHLCPNNINKMFYRACLRASIRGVKAIFARMSSLSPYWDNYSKFYSARSCSLLTVVT
jgi:hypothetical protein